MDVRDDRQWKNYAHRVRNRLDDLRQEIRKIAHSVAEAPRSLQIGAGAAMVLTALLALAIVSFTPSAADLGRDSFNRATIVYTADGEVVTRYYRENRTWVGLDDISPAVVEALIATEDRRFYEHSGVDIQRTVVAVFKTLTGQVQGGSTITMQLARNAFPELKQHPMLVRKVMEWITASRIELSHSKEKILELYLNTVPFVFHAYGIEAAALTYFGKHASELDVLEAATLVGMLKGPSTYNPVLNPERSRERRDVVLENLVRSDFLSREKMEALRGQATPLDFQPSTPESSFAPHFAEHVRRRLDAWADEHGYNLYTSGLRVYTTLDADLQRAANSALHQTMEDLQAVVDVSWSASSVPYFSQRAEAYAPHHDRGRAFDYFWASNPQVVDRLIRHSDSYARYIDGGMSDQQALDRLREDAALTDSLKAVASTLQGGFVAFDPTSGHVRAWVGGRDFSTNKFDHVAQARRQPGSTFKPFVYAAALAHGYLPGDALPDWQFRYVNHATGQTWAPGNFSGTSGSLLSLRHALRYSKNTITAQLVMRLGPRRIAEYAQRMGIRSELDPVPSIGLGTSPVSLLELTAAYGTIANLGTYREPLTITRIENQDGDVVDSFESSAHQAIPAPVAYAVLDMMRGVVDGGTGVRIRSQYGAGGDLAGKTGTTQRGADGWFMLLHPDLIMGSWAGFDLQELTFRTTWWGQGAHTALHTVGGFFNQVSLPEKTFPEPPGLRGQGTAEAEYTSLVELLRQSRETRGGSGGGNGSRIVPEPTDSDWTVAGYGDDWTGPAPGTPGLSASAWLNHRERQTSRVRYYLDRLRAQRD